MNTQPTTPATGRLLSLDVYRGGTMLLLALCDHYGDWAQNIAAAYPQWPWLESVARQFEHVEWSGLVLWDMIQPSFMFMVGVAMAYSAASRARRGDSPRKIFGHVVWRAVALVLLGVFLRSAHSHSTNWTLEDVVSQIGLGYVPLYLLWRGGVRVQVGAVVVILIGYWLLFALWPLPGDEYDYGAVQGAPYFTGFFAHWNMNSGPAHFFDQWLLNLFPRAEPFIANDGGYNTLNFVPSLATMLMGSLAGGLLQSDRPGKQKFLTLLAWGAGLFCLGWALHYVGVCPVVKKLWTPAFAFASGGLCLAILGGLYGLIDLAGYRRGTFPFVVVGMNPLAIYVLMHLLGGWIIHTLTTHLGPGPFLILGEPYELLLKNLAIGAILWLICWWMYRRQIFLRL